MPAVINLASPLMRVDLPPLLRSIALRPDARTERRGTSLTGDTNRSYKQ